MKRTPIPRPLLALTALAAAVTVSNLSHAQYNVLWWDSTPTWGTQALDAYREEMSDYVDTYAGGAVFDSTYVSSETPGTLAAHLASNAYDVIVFDATSYDQKFNAADLTAIQSFYANNNKNLLLDGTLYIRSIDYNVGSDFPGVDNDTGDFTVNEVHQLATRGGGIMIGTDHEGVQFDANQVLQAILPSAAFTGITYPSTDGLFHGTHLLNSIEPVAALNIFNHWDTIDTQAIAPTGAYTDYLGATVTLYSQVDVANAPGGGTKYSYISTSWQPSSGSTGVTDPNQGGSGGTSVPDSGATLPLLGLSLVALAWSRRRA